MRKCAAADDLRSDHADHETGPDQREHQAERVDPYAVLSVLTRDQLWDQEEPRDSIGRVVVPCPADIEILETGLPSWYRMVMGWSPLASSSEPSRRLRSESMIGRLSHLSTRDRPREPRTDIDRAAARSRIHAT